MKNITNAYLVLSVAEIRTLLHAAELEQKFRGEARESICVCLENITVLCEGEGYPQIASWSVTAAAQASAKLSETDLAIRAEKQAIREHRREASLWRPSAPKFPMTLEFNREVIVVAGLPVLGTITVDVDAERDPYNGSWALDLDVTAFEPETPMAGLLWSDVRGSCDAWLTANYARVERRALK